MPPNKPTIAIDTHELSWAAGFFDGEGTVLWRGRKRLELAMTISQSDLRPLLRFHRAIGHIGTLRGPYKPKGKDHYKQCWVVGTHGHAATQAVIALLWKWLSEPKREQASAAMAAAIPYYRNRSVWGKGRSVLSMGDVERIRAAHLAAQAGRHRVPKGWRKSIAAEYGINLHTLAAICGGRGYVA